MAEHAILAADRIVHAVHTLGQSPVSEFNWQLEQLPNRI